MTLETPPRTRLILASENLLDLIGTRTEDGYRLTFEWGDPTPAGWYEPRFTVHRDEPLPLNEDALRRAIHRGLPFRCDPAIVADIVRAYFDFAGQLLGETGDESEAES